MRKRSAYGPVPSRRLGRSLGINNIPTKVCSYACAYCQVGSTGRREIERRAFYAPEEILRAVEQRLASVVRAGEHVDYLSFVPDGEPTLDLNLGREIGLLKRLGLPIAVISNSSLLAVGGTAEDLAAADWVSLKADTVDESAWRRLNRPHRSLDLQDVHEGMLAFCELFHGRLVTETMLVADVNDSPVHAADTASFLAALAPDVAYLSIPSRPPAASWVRIPDDLAMVRCHDQFAGRLPCVEYLMGYEGDQFSAAGHPRDTPAGNHRGAIDAGRCGEGGPGRIRCQLDRGGRAAGGRHPERNEVPRTQVLPATAAATPDRAIVHDRRGQARRIRINSSGSVSSLSCL